MDNKKAHAEKAWANLSVFGLPAASIAESWFYTFFVVIPFSQLSLLFTYSIIFSVEKPARKLMCVCEECDWSLSTYYRKSKPFKDLKSGSSPHSGISNAEKEMIKRMAKEIKTTINRDLDKILMY